MSVLAAVVAITLSQGQPERLFPQIFDARDLTNGYQEYVLAADLSIDLKLRDLVRHDAPPLVRAQKVAAVIGPIARLIEEGNRKKVWRPGLDSFDTLLIELTYFRDLIRGLGEASYADAAAGQWAKANSYLLNALHFSHRLDANLIYRLVGMAGAATVISQLRQQLPRMPVPELERMDREIANLLLNDQSGANALKNEFAVIRATIIKAQKDPALIKEFFANEEGELTDIGRKFLETDPQGREQLVRQIVSSINKHADSATAAFAGPESGWKGLETQGDEFAETFLPVYAGFMPAVARYRTQLRLARLTSKLELYRWKHAALPANLSDFTLPTDRHDPLAGKDFVYRTLSGNDFELYSEGGLGSGRIDLVYKRPADPQLDEPNP